MRSYCGHSGVLGRASQVAPYIVADLRHDLRALGYHRGGINGIWGPELDAAIRSLRYDLAHGDRTSGIGAYNANGAVVAAPASGASGVEPAMAAAIAAMMDDANFAKLPSSPDAQADNQRAWASVMAIRDGVAPAPFLAAIFQQESSGCHYHVPSPDNPDSFVTAGFDRNDPQAPDHITSRGYGISQFTLFHHPPAPDEVSALIVDPVGNARAAFAMLRQKFDYELVSPDPAFSAEHRLAEWPVSALRGCKYPKDDPRYMADCKACALAAGNVNITPGQPVYPGATLTWSATALYPSAAYEGVPDRTGFPCDWPYAVRRYNGGGIESYHYETRVLINLVHLA